MTAPHDQPVLPDGSYHAFIVDADEDPSHQGDGDLLHLSVTILTGEHKGEVIDLAATGMDHSSIDLIGMPATLVVEGGVPRLTVDT